MPNIKSAEKRVDIAKTRTLRNNMIKSNLKTSLKKFDEALTSNDEAKIKETYSAAVSTVDKACAKGVLKKNTANNKKAALGKKLNAN